MDHEILGAQHRLAADLARTGAKVREVQPELFGDLRDPYKLYRSLISAHVHVGRPEMERQMELEAMRGKDDEFEVAWARGIAASADEYIGWCNRREVYRVAHRSFFEDWDVLLSPANIVTAFPHTTEPFYLRRVDVNGQAVRYEFQAVYPGIANITGQPATAFPAGLTRVGLPIGLQAMGPYLEDCTPIHFAELVAREFGGFVPPPGYEVT